jgi:flagellar motor switch protein FliN/FliY
LSSSSELEQALPDALLPFADVPCRVDIVLGHGTMTLRTCLALQKGSIVKIASSAGQDLSLVINGVLLGHGEVVVIDDSVSLRFTELRRAHGDQR